MESPKGQYRLVLALASEIFAPFVAAGSPLASLLNVKGAA